jgi:hypothetical protein
MRTRISLLTVLLLLALLVWPKTACAQGSDVPPPSVIVPWPFGRPHLDQGGFYFAGEFLMWRETNPLRSQPLAFRGLTDWDGTVGAALGIPSFPGNFIGTHLTALDVNSVSGPNPLQPGYGATVGYRFANGIAMEIKWIHLTEAHYSAAASLQPATSIGVFSEETFMTSPVYNFPSAYAGPGNQTGLGSQISTFGLWNATTLQQESFTQRLDIWELGFRIPMQDSECWRIYGLIGPRLVAMWESFKWTVVNPEQNGNTPPNDIANYTNIVSNRLYGVHIGVGNEWMLGDTPAGAFSLSLDVQGALYADFTHAIPSYELGDKSTAASHSRYFTTLSPEVEGAVNLWWYPYEGIIFRIGYSAMAFFNTVASPRPVDFNFGAITPGYEKTTFRLFDGFNVGAGIIW